MLAGVPDRLPVASSRLRWLRYAGVVPGVALAALVTMHLPPLAERAPFALFFGVVAVSAVYGGLGPALLAIALSAPISAALFLLPSGDSTFGSDAMRLGTFGVVASLIGVLGELRLRSERSERARREWSEVTLASIGDAVIVTDVESRVLSMNGAAEKATGWSRAEARGRQLPEVFAIENEETGERARDPVERVRREKRVVGLANHTVLVRRGGDRIPIDDSGAPIWSEDGRLVGAVLVFRDISERKEAERRQAALLENERLAKQEAEAANRAKDSFLAVLSHELRTPLNAILGWTQLLREGGVAASELQRGLEVIDRNARLQTRLIDDVLDVSRIVSGKLRVEFARVDLGHVVETVVERVRPALAGKQLQLQVRGDCGGRVLGDAHRLEQIVGNLLSNATKFTPAGGRIEIAMQRVGDCCELAVSDSGRGIAPEFLPHVFDLFRQEDAASTRRYGGLGLGLAIVRHLAEMHGGSVEVTSLGVGKGTTALLRLPLARPDASPGAAEAGATHPPLASSDLRGIRVLAVDDDPDSREIVASILTRAGAEVRTVASAAEALRVVEEWQPEVLISDLEMPEIDGCALIQQLRSRGADLPAIALTAYAAAPERVRALEAGFDLHLAKPVDAADLQLLVAGAVYRRQAVRG
jgi:PAS domain S-box-containing protein